MKELSLFQVLMLTISLTFTIICATRSTPLISFTTNVIRIKAEKRKIIQKNYKKKTPMKEDKGIPYTEETKQPRYIRL